MTSKYSDEGKLMTREIVNIDLVKNIKKRQKKNKLAGIEDGERYITVPDEVIDYVKTKNKGKKPEEYYFDFQGDGRSLPKKKKTKLEKIMKPYTIINGKKVFTKDFHTL